MEQQDILACRRRHFVAILFRAILFDFAIDKIYLSKVFSQNVSYFLHPVGFFAWRRRYANHTSISA